MSLFRFKKRVQTLHCTAKRRLAAWVYLNMVSSPQNIKIPFPQNPQNLFFLDSSAYMCSWEPLEEFLDAVVPATKSKISSSRIVATSCTCANALTIAWMHNDSVSMAVSTQDTATCVHAGHSNVQDTGLCSLPCPGTQLRNAQQQLRL